MTDIASALAAAVRRAPFWTLGAVVVALMLAVIGESFNAFCVASAAGGVLAAAFVARPGRQIAWMGLAGTLVCGVSLVAALALDQAGALEFPFVQVALAGLAVSGAVGVSALARAAATRGTLHDIVGVLVVSFLAAHATVVWISESQSFGVDGLAGSLLLGVTWLGTCGVALLVVLDGTWLRWLAYPLAGYALHKLGSFDAPAIAGSIALAIVGGRAARVARLERPRFDDAVASLASRVACRPWRTVLSVALVSLCVWYSLVDLGAAAAMELWRHDGRTDSSLVDVWVVYGALPSPFLAAALVMQAALERSSQLVERLVPWIAFCVGAAAFSFWIPDVQEFLGIGDDVAVNHRTWMVPIAFAALVPGALVASRPPHGRVGLLECALLVMTVVAIVKIGFAAHMFEDTQAFQVLYYVGLLAVAAWFALITRTAATLMSVQWMWFFALLTTAAITAGLTIFVDDTRLIVVVGGYVGLYAATGVCATVLTRRLRCLTPLSADHPARLLPE